MSAESRRHRDDGIADLFSTAYEPMCRLAFVIVGDQQLAEEIVMDALMNVYRRWDRVERSPEYLRRSVVNGSRTALRSKGRARMKVRRWAARERVEDGVIDGPESSHVVDAVRRLPERQRTCVALYYFEDLAVADIAGLLGCSQGTVKSQLSKARESIRTALESHHDG